MSILSEKAIDLSVLRIHVLGDHILHRLRLHHAHMAFNQLAVLIEVDGGDGGNAVLLRNFWVLSGVEFDDVQEWDLRLNVLQDFGKQLAGDAGGCLLYTSPSPRDS